MIPVEALPEAAQKLRRFIGSWQMEGVMVGGDSRQAITGQWRFDEAADGWGVTGHMTTDVEVLGSFEERELIGFDSATARIHMFSMNRFAVRDHVGGFEGETLVTRYVSEDGGTMEEIHVRFTNRDQLEASISEHADGQLVLATELTLDLQEHP